MAYDVSTETRAGERRLRRVAHVCEAFGQRVQKSVFECTLDEGDVEVLKAKLLTIIKEDEDRLRIYRLREPRHRYLWAVGKAVSHDMHDPLII